MSGVVGNCMWGTKKNRKKILSDIDKGKERSEESTRSSCMSAVKSEQK